MPKYKTGLLIGRFQPFHLGHLYLLQKALENVDQLIVGIGSPNSENHTINPFDYDDRVKMINRVFSKEKIASKVKKILPVYDFLESDEKWYTETIKSVGKFDLYIGNDDWTTGIFKSHGHEILRFPLFKRELYEGVKIRKLIDEKKDWSARVPVYLEEEIKELI